MFKADSVERRYKLGINILKVFIALAIPSLIVSVFYEDIAKLDKKISSMTHYTAPKELKRWCTRQTNELAVRFATNKRLNYPPHLMRLVFDLYGGDKAYNLYLLYLQNDGRKAESYLSSLKNEMYISCVNRFNQ